MMFFALRRGVLVNGIPLQFVRWSWRASQQPARVKVAVDVPHEDEPSEKSSKARNLEARIQRIALADPGKTLGELALCSKPSVLSLQEKHDIERKHVAQMCVKFFHWVGPVGKLFQQLFGPKGDQRPPEAMLIMLEDMFFTIKSIEREAATATEKDIAASAIYLCPGWSRWNCDSRQPPYSRWQPSYVIGNH